MEIYSVSEFWDLSLELHTCNQKASQNRQMRLHQVITIPFANPHSFSAWQGLTYISAHFLPIGIFFAVLRPDLKNSQSVRFLTMP